MSIKLMSAIYDTEIGDLPCSKTVRHNDGTEECVNYVAKASTSKSILLAIADHANDYGQGAFPGLRKLEKKTELSRPAIIDTINALRAVGLLSVGAEPSMLGTNDYTINIRAFPKMADEAAQLPDVVKPLNQGGKATLPGVVKPLNHNHPLTTIEPEINIDPVAQKLSELHFPLNPNAGVIIQGWKNDFPGRDDIIIRAITEHASKRNLTYIDRVLIDWKANGVPPTREERIAAAKSQKGNYGTNQSSTPKTAVQEPTPAEIDIARRVLARQQAAAATGV